MGHKRMGDKTKGNMVKGKWGTIRRDDNGRQKDEESQDKRIITKGRETK